MASFSRRAAFTLPAALVTAAPAAASLPAVKNPDHDLLALCRRYATYGRRYTRLFELECDAERRGERALEQRITHKLCRIVPYGHELEWQIAQHPAATMEGLIAKARAAELKVEFLSDGTPHDECAIFWSVCQDVLRR